MTQVVELPWARLIQIQPTWVEQLLIECEKCSEPKLTARAYCLKFAGTQENLIGLVDMMAEFIKKFVFSEAELKAFEDKGRDPWRQAIKYFGDTDPQREGKYGELLLFLFVESVLQTPLIAHKIQALTDYNDQVKGSDGVFFGKYREVDTLLLGESKMYQNRNNAINDALDSVNKFHAGASAQQELTTELLVIRKNLTKDLTSQDVDMLLEMLDINSPRHQAINKAHPVLIVYDEDSIPEIEKACTCSEDASERLDAQFKRIAHELHPIIKSKINDRTPELNAVSLDFFLLPVSSVQTFREMMYEALHNTKW
ncbi:TPA: DUF1837 domain-containing protein [Candidatus Woesearchaeota archaeon]|nr:DUF1837 domain-containing protein [Candidatus Woesearchaeota archaeon]